MPPATWQLQQWLCTIGRTSLYQVSAAAEPPPLPPPVCSDPPPEPPPEPPGDAEGPHAAKQIDNSNASLRGMGFRTRIGRCGCGAVGVSGGCGILLAVDMVHARVELISGGSMSNRIGKGPKAASTSKAETKKAETKKTETKKADA